MSNQQITEENVVKLTIENSELRRENFELKEKLADFTKMQEEIDKLKVEKFALQKQIEVGKGKIPADENCQLSIKMNERKPIKFIPNWLLEILAWIKRLEMTDSSLPTSCDIFNQLCFPKLHGNNVKPHSSASLRFSRHRDKYGNIHANLKHKNYVDVDQYDGEYVDEYCNYSFGYPIPVPFLPPPGYIQLIKHIEFEFLDDQLLEFTKNILHLMRNKINIIVDMNMKRWNLDNRQVAQMNRLLILLCNIIKEIQISFEYGIKEFFTFFPDIINQNQIDVHYIDYLKANEIHILMEWMANSSHKRNDNAKQICIKIDK